jgi:hypothetical protein
VTAPIFDQYRFTMYFVCFGVTNSPFFQANWFEAFLWICEILGLGLVFVAFVFGVILDRVADLREERAQLQVKIFVVWKCSLYSFSHVAMPRQNRRVLRRSQPSRQGGAQNCEEVAADGRTRNVGAD